MAAYLCPSLKSHLYTVLESEALDMMSLEEKEVTGHSLDPLLK